MDTHRLLTDLTRIGMECLINALSSELNMWLSLKKEKPHDSWNFLIDAQDYMEASIRAADIHGFERHVYTEKLSLIEKSVFPPQSFMSPVWLVKSSTCTICRRKYRDCDHISGKAYMGVFCAEEVDRYDILSVASVPEPWDKRRRTFSFIQNGMERDFMTLKVSKISKEEHERLYGTTNNIRPRKPSG